MAEYIEREALIEILKNWRDAHAAVDDEEGCGLIEDVMWEINAQATVDVAPVVHCKDCKHREDIAGYGLSAGYCVLHSSACAGYCGDGEYTRNTEGIKYEKGIITGLRIAQTIAEIVERNSEVSE